MERRPLLSTIAEFPVPTAHSYPLGITAGPDGDLWFTDSGTNSIGMINPTTHAIAEFPAPTANSGLNYITTGPDGNLWFTESRGDIGMINPTTHAIAEFPIPTSNSAPRDITTGPDGNLWFTDPGTNSIGMINPTTHAIAEFPVPTFKFTVGEFFRRASGITAGPDGNLWFTASESIGAIDPTTHTIAQFSLPSTQSSSVGITTGPDGNLWFTDEGTASIGMINPTTHAIAEFPVPTSLTVGITTGPNGNLWFTNFGLTVFGHGILAPAESAIGMINPTTHAIAEFPVPTADSAPGDITTGPDGNLWFTETAGIGEFPLGATAVAPPQVVGRVGQSQSRSGTSYAIAFDQPLSTNAATDVALYQVLEGMTKVVKRHKETLYTKPLKIKGVAYNPATNTVTIMLSKRYKGTGQVTIAPGLVGLGGTTSSTIALDVR